MMNIFLYFLAINALTYFLYWWDKRQARWSGSRIPETVLLLVGFAGGSVGAFVAQRVCRHKTKKQPFKTIFWILVIVQLYLVFAYFNPPPEILPAQAGY
jgi:uncharacterized membrane protein YsdA (DUF1294 family)